MNSISIWIRGFPSFRGARQREPGISRFRVRSLRSRPGMTALKMPAQPNLNEWLISPIIAASLRSPRISSCGRDGRSIRNSYAPRHDRAAPIDAWWLRWRLQRSLADKTARRHDLHHPRRQRGTRLPLADPARALDGRLGLWRLCLCLDLGAAARQHDGFWYFGVGAEDHSGIPDRRRACAADRRSSRCCWRV